MEIKNGNVRKLYIIAFGLIITIIGTVFVYLFNCYNRTEARVETYSNQVEEYQASVSDLKADMGIIKNDLSWIKDALNKKITNPN